MKISQDSEFTVAYSVPLRDVHTGAEAPRQDEHDRDGEEAQAYSLRNARQAIRPWRPQLQPARS